MSRLPWYGDRVTPEEMLKRGYTRETSIRRDPAGRWFDGEERIAHDNLVRSFERWIDRAPDGRFCLKNDIHWVYATIEGAPYFVRSVTIEGDQVRLHLSGDRVEILDPHTLRTAPDDSLWCDVLEGRVPARFENHATTQLAPLLVEQGLAMALVIGGETIEPPRVDDPMAGWDPSKGHVESA